MRDMLKQNTVTRNLKVKDTRIFTWYQQPLQVVTNPQGHAQRMKFIRSELFKVQTPIDLYKT